MADKKSGGIREDKLIRLLPNSCHEQDSAIVARKYGLNYILLVAASKGKKRHRRIRKKDMRVISRGAFLSMFGYESSAFIHSIFVNEKTIRAKEKEKRMKAILQNPPSQPRERAQTDPNVSRLKQPQLLRESSNQSILSSSDASAASHSPSPRHRRKKSRVLPFNNELLHIQQSESDSSIDRVMYKKSARSMPLYVTERGSDVEDDVSDLESGFLTPPTVNSSPCNTPNRNSSSSNDTDKIGCFSIFSLVENVMKKLCPKLDHKQSNLLVYSQVKNHSFENNLNNLSDNSSAVLTPSEAISNAQSIANYLKGPESLPIEGDIFVDLDDHRRHRRSPSFCLSDDEPDQMM